MSGQKTAPIARLSFTAGLIAAGALLVSGLGVQWGLWSWRSGLTILRWTAWGGLGVLAVGLIACFYVTTGTARQGLVFATIGGLCGLLAFIIPASMVSKARSVPRIHDITTDTLNPPQFVDILPIREKAKARNSTDYAGEKIAVQQRRAYPKVATFTTSRPASELFDAALQAATGQGWDIVASKAAEGRIEATDTTFWFGFKDDVVIRVRPSDTGSVLDIRSVSRVGRSDVGANAARIHRYLAALKADLQP